MQIARQRLARVARFLRTEAGPLAILAVGLYALYLFLHITSETLFEGEGRAFDEGVLNALRVAGQPDAPVGPVWLPEMARDLSSLGSISVLVFVAAVVIGFALVRKRYGASTMIFIALAGGMVVVQALKQHFERERPPLAYHLEPVINASFPSGHAMLSAVFYLTLAVLLARVQQQKRMKVYVIAVAVVSTAMVGLTRIYLGVHWTTDVLAGWSVGCAWAVACWFLSFAWERLAHRKMSEQGPPVFGHAAEESAASP
ncbi:MAG TPA: phosphatase PAP2 family protein [Caulobacteraceae bacterium]|jgi:undecaprenyl-diphosphatase|nr:phosphatase PAP2 family protein [Caulobacteraceae bacterium]